MVDLKQTLKTLGGVRPYVKEKIVNQLLKEWLLGAYLTGEQRDRFSRQRDPFRYATLFLALEEITKRGIPGSLAECGVYQGVTSRFIRETVPDRTLYLFDTFEGFALQDEHAAGDGRFKDTSVEAVLKRIGTTDNVVVRKGFFPDTTRGLEQETFAFALLDFDKYDPTLAALKFFYPRLSRGGYVFIHDFNSPESAWACSRAVNEFLADKDEKPIGIADAAGSAVFRKC